MNTSNSHPRILIANRGEIAVRIARSIREFGGVAVAVHPADDATSLHVRQADEAIELPGQGAPAYLDIDSIVKAAVDSGCTAIHPGYGFLSENADFAQKCADSGLIFIGPAPDTLQMLGDKARARAFAAENGVAVLPGTEGATTLEQARAFATTHGAVMVKALAGGGGRGMREVREIDELDEAFERCQSEARAAFGNDAVYVERLLLQPRHIEIQVIGDGTSVQHLGERDCSIQRRHQKIVEVAPSPALDDALRQEIFAAALKLAAALNYRNLGTFEFLVDGGEFFFMEANPRLQVEHTITEEVTGVDLVAAQLEVAVNQATLARLDLAEAPARQGYAVQARVNLESMDAQGAPRPASGTITSFAAPSGPRVRVDSYGYAGYRVSPRYDSLIAKVITHADDYRTAARRGAAALAEFSLDGVASNLDLLHAILSDRDFTAGRFDTTYIATHLGQLLAHRRPHRGAPTANGDAAPAEAAAQVAVPDGMATVTATLSGAIVDVRVQPGQVVPAGTTVAVLESMKMEHLMHAPQDLRIDTVCVAAGDLVDEGGLLAWGEPVEAGEAATANVAAEKEDWSAEVAEIARRREFAMAMGGPDKIKRQHDTGRLTARERIKALSDTGSFREIGVLTGFAEYDKDGRATKVEPANFIGGTARLDGRKVMLGVDDFTRRGGSGDAAIHAKQLFLEAHAGRMRLPMIRLLDGQSGGGSVKMIRKNRFTYIPVNPAWDSVVDNMSLIPVVSAGLGPTVGLGAARFVMSHFSILVEGIGQLFTAGPPVVLGGTGEDLTKEELGGAQIHRNNGSVERFVHTEEEAFQLVRNFLSYLPNSVFELPPVQACTDPAERREEALLGAIPRSKRRPYEIGPILDAVFDAGSVFTYAEYGDSTVTALARLDGHPVGVIAGDPMKGAAMSVEGSMAITRLADLCETFHLPIVSLTDQAGVNIGSVAERRATIRAGCRAIAAVYQARVPQAEIILRRVYGVGGAGIVNRHQANRSWAWPSGDWGSLPARGGIEAAFRSEIRASNNPEATMERLANELSQLTSPFRTAEHFGTQDLIDPRDSRALLCDWVHDAYRVLPELVGRPAFGCRP